ncbi:MAG: hypothetical protein SFU56_15700 [Capsulimonadales bacterium]|nr:hypothetical protein [Capsulimonadales bacterium]
MTAATAVAVGLCAVAALLAGGCTPSETPSPSAPTGATGTTGQNAAPGTTAERPAGTPVGRPGMAGVPKN